LPHPIEYTYHQGYYETLEAIPIESQTDGTSQILERTYIRQDYPPFERFEGVPETIHHTNELRGEPLTTHVSVYHGSGRSDVKEVERGYPISEPYVGDLHRVGHNEAETLPMNVNVYHHSGRSDEKPKTSLFGSLFRKDHKDEFPTNIVYEGPLDSTNRHREAEHLPLDSHVNVYNKSGRSDDQPRIITEVYKAEIRTEYPSSDPYIGDLHQVGHNEAETLPMNVNVYHSGRSDEKPKTSLFGSLFKKEGFPKSEVYSGPLHSIRHSEIQPSPIENLPYHAYYDKLETRPTVIEERVEMTPALKGTFNRFI
jgi:hypothetical protein